MKYKCLNTFINAVLAGICISIGGWVFVSLYMNTKIVASILFALALSLICFYKFYLYTGKICYVLDNSENSHFIRFKILHLVLGLIGNYIGVLLFSSILKLSFNMEIADQLIQSKLNLSYLDCLIKGFGCGILVYFAVETYKQDQLKIHGYIIMILCVVVFILSGFEHSIADMFYLSLDSSITFESISKVLMIVLGNSIGGLFVPALKKLLNRTEKLWKN